MIFKKLPVFVVDDTGPDDRLVAILRVASETMEQSTKSASNGQDTMMPTICFGPAHAKTQTNKFFPSQK